jgi:anti-sigma-K factor RskA
MSNPAPNYEELAALRALGMLDAESTRLLLDAARRDPGVQQLLEAFDETTAHLACDAPDVPPPPGLRREIMDALPPEHGKVLAFSPLFPFAIAACLMVIGIIEAVEVFRLSDEKADLQAQLDTAQADVQHLRDSNALISLRLAALDPKDPAYAAARVLVAWDANQHHGSIALQNMPLTTAGHDYQLWVLDPNAPAPISAGVISAARPFEVTSVSTAKPGFAISLEPTGGSDKPTGPILFAVAPAE